MTIPNLKPGGERMTIREVYGPAMEVQTQEEADAYFEALVIRCMSSPEAPTRDEAVSIQKQNLGYFAGYCDSETRDRVERLFACAHPIFGKAAGGTHTAKEAFEASKAAAAQ